MQLRLYWSKSWYIVAMIVLVASYPFVICWQVSKSNFDIISWLKQLLRSSKFHLPYRSKLFYSILYIRILSSKVNQHILRFTNWQRVACISLFDSTTSHDHQHDHGNKEKLDNSNVFFKGERFSDVKLKVKTVLSRSTKQEVNFKVPTNLLNFSYLCHL